MAQDFLSQDEVDALLKGVTGEADEPEREEETGGIRKYDVGRQERIVRGRMPTLELINERFARYLRIGLFNYMHRTTERYRWGPSACRSTASSSAIWWCRPT